MTKIRSHLSLKSKCWWEFSVLLFGFFLEGVNKGILFPHTDYSDYYGYSALLRYVLFAYTLHIIYKVKGSVSLWVYGGFNLAAIYMNIVYQNPSFYYMLSPFRVDVFAPAYRAAELIILMRIAWDGFQLKRLIASALRRSRHWLGESRAIQCEGVKR